MLLLSHRTLARGIDVFTRYYLNTGLHTERGDVYLYVGKNVALALVTMFHNYWDYGVLLTKRKRYNRTFTLITRHYSPLY